MSRPRPLLAGDLKVAEAPARLVIHGLGSCVAVFVYDPETRVGGLAHILLPAPPAGGPGERAGRYATTAIETMIEESIRKGARREGLLAKITGGSRMFSFDAANARVTVGDKNVQAAMRALGEAGVQVIGTDVGGMSGRTVVADLSDGTLTITTVRGAAKSI